MNNYWPLKNGFLFLKYSRSSDLEIYLIFEELLSFAMKNIDKGKKGLQDLENPWRN